MNQHSSTATGRSSLPTNLKPGHMWRTSAVTGRSLGCVRLADPGEVRDAVDRAATVAVGWATTSPEMRAAAAAQVEESVGRSRNEIARTLAEEIGVPVDSPRPSETERREQGALGAVRAVVVGWNDPLAGSAELVVPALLAGQACVVLVAPEIALSGEVFADAVRRAGLPDDLVIVLPAGPAAVDALRDCAVELGEPSNEERKPPAAIVDVDADLSSFLGGFPVFSLAGNGQYGCAETRIFVARERYAEVVDAVTATVADLPVGDPREPGVRIGPVLDDWHVESLEAVAAQAWRAGARITLGGCRSPLWDNGSFLEPTVVAGADPFGPAAQTPVPGPIVTLLPYDGGLGGACLLIRRAGFRLGSVWAADGRTSESLHRIRSRRGELVVRS